MIPTRSDDPLDTDQLHSLPAQLLQHVEQFNKEVLHHKTRNQQLIHEITQLKRQRFDKRDESFSPDQTAIEAELEILAPKSAPSAARQQTKRSCRIVGNRFDCARRDGRPLTEKGRRAWIFDASIR